MKYFDLSTILLLGIMLPMLWEKWKHRRDAEVENETNMEHGELDQLEQGMNVDTKRESENKFGLSEKTDDLKAY